MGWITGIFAYFLIWWLTLFMVLPFGVRRDENPPAGAQPGAPARPHLKLKIMANFLVAGVLWLILYSVIEFDMISIRTLVGAPE